MELIFAYIDPGSGSLVIQALIAGLVAIPIFFRNQIGRVLRNLRGGPPAPGERVAGQDEPRADA